MINKKIILFLLIAGILLLSFVAVYTQPEKDKINERESKIGKYYFIPVTISALIIISVLWLFVKIKPENKFIVNMSNNIFMLFIFLFTAVSGILLIFGYKVQNFDLKFWHVIIGEVLVFSIIFHIIIHWNIWSSYFKRISKTK